MSCNLSKLIVVCLFAFSLSVQANASIMVGDIIRFQNGPGSPGGEFGIAHEASPLVTEFVTFCLEKNEHINFTDTFEVYDISDEADKGGVGGGPLDPIGEKTAWLYYNFRQGTLTGYDYGNITDNSNSRKDSANALQNAIWFLEEEQNSAGVGVSFVAAADAEYDDFINDAANYTGNMQAAIDSVKAMNIKWNSGWRKGKKAQSQLYMMENGSSGGTIPEPSTYIIWSLLMVGMMVGYRRHQAKLQAAASC